MLILETRGRKADSRARDTSLLQKDASITSWLRTEADGATGMATQRTTEPGERASRHEGLRRWLGQFPQQMNRPLERARESLRWMGDYQKLTIAQFHL